MSTKTKLKKAKSKLKKAKTRIKSLKTQNIDLMKQLGVEVVEKPKSPAKAAKSEQVEKKVKKAPKKAPASLNESTLSKNLNAKEVIARFQKMTDIEEIKSFTKGEKRPSVVQRAEFRINALTKSAT